MLKQTILSLLLLSGLVVADCPLDHYSIGINADGITGTEDDNRLFVDCSQIYRHSDPDNSSDETWLYRHYPMYYSAIYNRYQIGEPGFDEIGNDPNRQLQGTANIDYQIYVECVSVRTGLSARNTTYGIVLDSAGDMFCHSVLSDPHIHLQYRVGAPLADGPYWITYRVFDAMGRYETSQEFTLVFIEDPAAGDVIVDGAVNLSDLQRWLDYWLLENGNNANDYYNRCDINRDRRVNLIDFAILAQNWMKIS
jgi:Dockerin type I domain